MVISVALRLSSSLSPTMRALPLASYFCVHVIQTLMISLRSYCWELIAKFLLYFPLHEKINLLKGCRAHIWVKFSLNFWKWSFKGRNYKNDHLGDEICLDLGFNFYLRLKSDIVVAQFQCIFHHSSRSIWLINQYSYRIGGEHCENVGLKVWMELIYSCY